MTRQNAARLERALTRANYAYVRRFKKIPQSRWRIRRLYKINLRILAHAEKLGWVAR